MEDIEEVYIHPIRCYTCGKVIAHLTSSLEKIIKEGHDADAFLTSKGIPPSRYCCRRTLLSPIKGLFLYTEEDKDEKGIYIPETFEETQEESSEEEEAPRNITKRSLTAFRNEQKNITGRKAGLYSRGAKRTKKEKTKGRSIREMSEQVRQKRGIPGKSRKQK